MISHRGISVITPLPFGGGDGGGASFSLRAPPVSRKASVLCENL